MAPPVSLFGQLYWREFFYTVASDNPKFDRIAGNPICLQVPWNVDPVALAKWAEVHPPAPSYFHCMIEYVIGL